MSVFKVPITLCKSLQQLMAKFWWGLNRDGQGIHWMKWSKLCRSKFNGGMGFRDLMRFNQALIAKQGWRILNQPHTLMARLLRAKYYPNSSFLLASVGYRPSYVWRSIIWGRDLLGKGIRWRIASGRNVHIFKDPWLMRPLSFKPVTTPTVMNENMKVCDFISTSGEWNWDTIEATLWPIDHEELCRIPLTDVMGEDTIVWHYTSNREYSVKSGYQLAMNFGIEGSDGNRSELSKCYRKLWGLYIPPKVKIHVWKALNNILPVRSQLKVRGMQVDILCPRCHNLPETNSHALWHCPQLREVWENSALWPKLNCFKCMTIFDLWNWLVSDATCTDLGAFAMLLWSIWLSRNKLVFEGCVTSVQQVLDCANRLWGEFSLCQSVVSSSPSHSHRNLWCAPRLGVVKINVDAVVVPDLPYFGVGVVVRDEQGAVLFAKASRYLGKFSPHIAEIYAVHAGVLTALRFQWSAWILETDASNVVKGIHQFSPLALEAPIINFIKNFCLQRPGVQIQHCSSNANKVAHFLKLIVLEKYNAAFAYSKTLPKSSHHLELQQ